ncbi:MAG TPA: hypothetical protein VIQ31_30285 [Phormidium sp.]
MLENSTPTHRTSKFMIITNILSSRAFEKNPNYHLIYEWEEDLAQCLSIPISNAKPLHRKIFINRYSKKIINKIGNNTFAKFNNFIESRNSLVNNKNHFSLVFELYVESEPNFTNSAKAIPVMIDFWKHTNLEQFHKLYKDCKLVLISSLEALEFLKKSGCPLNIAHFPLSLSDRYRLKEGIIYPKQYDILLAGRFNIRTNQILLEYLQEFIAKYKDVEYLHQQEINGEYYYVSNHKGVVGKYQSREDYIDLLRASKVSFYSTPGLNGGEVRTGGFNPVTPRFLELLSAQCLLIGKYPDNEETRFYELDKVCPNVETYEQFEHTLLQHLNNTDTTFAAHREILDKHYTSRRAELLKQLMNAN